MGRFICGLLLVLWNVAASGQENRAQPAPSATTNSGPVMSAYEREQIRLKEAELQLEHQKAWINSIAVAVPLLAAVFAYWSTRKNQEQQARDSFQLKACEIAMGARNAYDAKGKAIALAALFPGKVPDFLGEKFDAEKYNWGRESRRELLSLIAAHAEHRAIIVKAWKALFPHDKWIEQLPDDF